MVEMDGTHPHAIREIWQRWMAHIHTLYVKYGTEMDGTHPHAIREIWHRDGWHTSKRYM